MGMSFFKHFLDADEGTLGELIEKLRVESYGRYWLLVELCCKEIKNRDLSTMTEDDMVFTFTGRRLREKLRIKSLSLELFLTSCRDLVLFEWTQVDDKHTFKFPKLLECIHRDAKRARTERAESAPKIKNKIKNKNKELELEVVSSEVHAPPSPLPLSDLDFFNQIKPVNVELVKTWVMSYTEEWVRAELTKAKMWCLANPKKKPKATGPFLNNWFSRGWESYRRTLPSEQPKKSVFDFEVDETKEIA